MKGNLGLFSLLNFKLFLKDKKKNQNKKNQKTSIQGQVLLISCFSRTIVLSLPPHTELPMWPLGTR